MNIKVQIKNRLSTNAIIASGISKEGDYLTFHAYSDQMKARILENLLNSRSEIYVSICDEARKDGEWYEPLANNAKKLQ